MCLIRTIDHQLSYFMMANLFENLSLAAAKLQSMASQALPCKTLPPPLEKRNEGGSMSILSTQHITMDLGSVVTGEAIQLKPNTLSPVQSISLRKPAVLVFAWK